MKNYLQVFGMLIAAFIFGIAANPAVGQPGPGGPNGMGPGMMGGYGGPGAGNGPVPRGGYGGPGFGMGPGMMGWGNYRELNLSAEQKVKITRIRQEMRTKQWAVMGEMMDAQDNMQDLYDVDKQDADAINKQYKEIEDLRRQMVNNSVEAHNQINSILTKEQREKARESSRGYGPMMLGY